MPAPKRIPPQNVVDGDHVLKDGKDAVIVRVLERCAHRSETRRRLMWLCVQEATLYGSTYSKQLCRAYGFNPDYCG